MSCWSGRRVERGKWAPPARRRACSESARGLTIVSVRIVTKFDDRDHPPSTRAGAGSSRSDGRRRGVGALPCLTVLGYVTLKTYLCINLKNNLASRLYLCRWPMTSVPLHLYNSCNVYTVMCTPILAAIRRQNRFIVSLQNSIVMPP